MTPIAGVLGMLLLIGKSSAWFFWDNDDSDEHWRTASSIYDFTVTDIDGNAVPLERYRGNVTLIVNVATN